MTREEIEKFSAVGPYRFQTDREEGWFEIGCIVGLETADAEPNLANLWHDASEEPEEKYEIICRDEFENVWLTNYSEDKKHYKNGWKECAECECIARWAYIKDLLLKN